jgi:hypothetical protein
MIQDLRLTIILFVCFALQVGSIIWQAASLTVSLQIDGTCESRIDANASIFQASIYLFVNVLVLAFIIHARVVVGTMEGATSRGHAREISVILLPFSIISVAVIAGWIFTASEGMSGAVTFSLLSVAYANTNIALFFIDKFQSADHQYVDKNDVEYDKSFNNRKSVVQSMRSFFQPTELYGGPSTYREEEEYGVGRREDEYSRKDNRDSFIHDEMEYEDYDVGDVDYRDSRYTDTEGHPSPRGNYEYSEYTRK